MISERELLAQLCHFINTKQVVMGDEDSIRDMVIRYKSPPFTIAYPAALRMTLKDTHELNELLKKAYEHLTSTADTPLSTPIVDIETNEHSD